MRARAGRGSGGARQAGGAYGTHPERLQLLLAQRAQRGRRVPRQVGGSFKEDASAVVGADPGGGWELEHAVVPAQ